MVLQGEASRAGLAYVHDIAFNGLTEDGGRLHPAAGVVAAAGVAAPAAGVAARIATPTAGIATAVVPAAGITAAVVPTAGVAAPITLILLRACRIVWPIRAGVGTGGVDVAAVA